MSLKENMRTLKTEREFAAWLLDVGEAKNGGKVILPSVCYPPTQDPVKQLYNDIDFAAVTPQQLKMCAILTVTYELSMEINQRVLNFLPGSEVVYESVDTVLSEDPQDTLTYPEEFLNSLTPTGMPPHKLSVKCGAIVMLFRNLAPSKGLCNSTRLIVTNLQRNILETRKIENDENETFFIPRIYPIPSDHSGPSSIAMMATWVYIFLALQFAGHVRLAFAFRAAVFEHAEQSHASSSYLPEDIVRRNLEYYSRAVHFARSKGVEVIVFPEYGIFPPIGDRKRLKTFLEHVPDPRAVSSNPCQEPDSHKDRPILYTLSCLARDNGMVIVANMGDIQPCRRERGCPKDGDLCFNTNVAFDRDGRILAKYHKEHLFDEPGMDVPAPGQDPTFECHLGRFATFVCFDIVFQRMAEVSRWEGIRAVLFTTMWADNGPLFNSLQYFEAWAVGNNVSLLAANVHLPGISGLGSGIVKGREGTRVYTFNPDGNSKLLLANLGWHQCTPEPESSIYIVSEEGVREWTDDGKDVGTECSKKVLKPAKDIYKDYRCNERDTSDFTLTKLETPSGRVESCQGGVCCTLEYTADELRGDFYLGVFNGTYNAIDRYFFSEEDCFLARCDRLGEKACVTFPTRSETLFRRVRMWANFSTDFVYPSVVESGMRLTPTSQWTFETADRWSTLSLDDASGKNLLVLGLKARPYHRDPTYVK